MSWKPKTMEQRLTRAAGFRRHYERHRETVLEKKRRRLQFKKLARQFDAINEVMEASA